MGRQDVQKQINDRSGDGLTDTANADIVIEISAAVDRQAAEVLQLEAARLLAQHGLKVRAVSVTRAPASETDEDSAEAT